MPKPVLTVAAAWAAFDAAMANAEKVAVRRVFYAGAQAVLDILLAGLEPTVEVCRGFLTWMVRSMMSRISIGCLAAAVR